jgi:hypothetical protein
MIHQYAPSIVAALLLLFWACCSHRNWCPRELVCANKRMQQLRCHPVNSMLGMHGPLGLGQH